MKIDIEKFIVDCIRKAENTVATDCMSEVMSGHIFKGALREQGLEYRDGRIVEIGKEQEEDAPRRYLVYSMDDWKFHEVKERPPLDGSDDCYVPVRGTPFVVRHSDYNHHVAHDIAVSCDTEAFKHLQTYLVRHGI